MLAPATSYVPRTTPRQKQVEALTRIKNRPTKPSDQDVFALLMGMRTGKSKVICDEFGTREASGDLQDLLIVAPAGAYRDWFADRTTSDGTPILSHLSTHLSTDLRSRIRVEHWRSGNSKQKKAVAALLKPDQRPRALIVNVEALSTVEDAKSACADFLRTPERRAMMVVDESTTVRSSGAARADEILRLGKLAPVRRILTGLVSPKSPLDVFWQFFFLDWRILGIQSPTAFRSRYAIVKRRCFAPNEVLHAKYRQCIGLKDGDTQFSTELLRSKLQKTWGDRQVDPLWHRDQIVYELKNYQDYAKRDQILEAILAMGGWIQNAPMIEGFRNIEELSEKIAAYSFRCRLEDCYDAPERAYTYLEVELAPEQKRIYKGLLENATAEISDGKFVTATHVLTGMLRRHQLLCGRTTVDDTGEVVELPENRTKTLVNYLREREGKAIIWCSYDADVQKVHLALEKEFGEGICARYWGGNRQTRDAEELRFRGEEACKYIVATPAAAMYSKLWRVANIVIYYTSGPNLEHRAQSEDRAQDVGKKDFVTYVDMVVRGTVDETYLKVLKGKIDLSAAINGEGPRKWLELEKV